MPQKDVSPHMDELYSDLGYGKADGIEKFKKLDKDIHSHFTSYEQQVGVLGSRNAISDQIVLCATKYLTESRGARFWPKNSRGSPSWPIDEQL